MKLKTAIELYGGGAGSGCHGENCGRLSTGLSDDLKQQMRELGYVKEVGKYSADLYHASDDGKLKDHAGRGIFLSDDKDAVSQFGSKIVEHRVDVQNAIKFDSAHSMFRYLLGNEGAQEWQGVRYARVPGTKMMNQRETTDPEYVKGLMRLETKAAEAARSMGYDAVISPFTRSADQVWVLDRKGVR